MLGRGAQHDVQLADMLDELGFRPGHVASVERNQIGLMTIKTPFETIPAEAEAIEVADGVLWLRLPLPMALDHVNIYAFADDDGWTIIDTGFASKRGIALWEAILAGPLKGKPLRRVIVTHHHPDHVGMAAWLMARGAELCTSRTSWLMARMLTLDVQEVPTPEALIFYKRAGMAPEVYEKRKSDRPYNFIDVVKPLPQGYTRLIEGNTIRFGGRTWDIRMGDGHAPEHVTLWSRDDGLVIGGDQLLLSISPNLGVYPNEPGADPVADWIASCEKFQPFARDDQLVLGGHKIPYLGLPHRLEQMIHNHHEALERLLAYLDTPKSAGACFKPLFKRKIGSAEYGLALVEAVAHMNHLHQTGLAKRTLSDDRND